MPKVKLPRGEWESILVTLELAQQHNIVAYLDPLIKEIEDQVYAQEY